MAKDRLEGEVLKRRFSATAEDEELKRVLRSTDIPTQRRYQHALKKDGKVDKSKDLPNDSILKALSQMQMSNHQDYRAIIELLPEIERGMSILESAVLSPKDMLAPRLMYRLNEETQYDFKSEFLAAIQTYLTSNYSLNERLPTIVREALHSKGSYVLGAIPRNTIDQLVNEGEEKVNFQSLTGHADKDSLFAPLGLLAIPTADTVNSAKPNMQSMTEFLPSNLKEECFHVGGLPDLTITDNFNAVKLPRIMSARRHNRITSAIRPKVGLRRKKEDVVNMQAASVDNLRELFKRRDYKRADSLVLESAQGSEHVYGRPLEMNWPTEAVIPVHVGGDVSKKVGIILLTDENGEAITADSVESQFRVLQSSLRSSAENDMSVNVERVQEALGKARAGGGSAINSKNHIKELNESFRSMVITDLVDRLSKDLYGSEVGISDSDTILNLAFKRMLCARKTRMVFIPEEIATYIAFDYDEFGLGRSRLESSKIIASMRAILLYTNMNAAMTNATPNMKLNIKLDEHDEDPEATVEDTIAEFYALNAMRLQPGATLNSADITRLLQQMGVTISVSGNTRYPDTQVDLEDVGRNKALIDRDLDESLAKRIWMMMGLSPDAVDSSMTVEFARTIVSNNLFLAKQASEIQSTLLFHYSAHARKLIYSDGNLMSELIRIVEDNSKGLSELEMMDAVNDCIESFHLALPSTDIAKIESQQQAFENYASFIEQGIEAWLNEDMLDGLVEGELDSVVRPAMRAYRDMMLRDFMIRENILPELQSISSGSDNDIDLGTRFKNHATPIVNAMESLLEHFRALSRKADEDEEARIAKEEEKRREKEEAEAEAARREKEANNPPEEDVTDPALEEGDEPNVEEEVEEADPTEETDPESEEEGGDEPEAEAEAGNEAGNDDGLDDLDALDTLDL